MSLPKKSMLFEEVRRAALANFVVYVRLPTLPEPKLNGFSQRENPCRRGHAGRGEHRK